MNFIKTHYILATLLVASFLSASSQNQNQAQKLGTFINVVQQTYVDTVNSNQLVEKAINSVLKELDPHSVYIPAKDLKKMNEPLVGNFEGVGIQFNILKDTIIVVSPVSGGPSEKVGVMSGDKIVEIDGELVAGVGFKTKDVVDNLRGEKGSKVVMGIFRRGEEEILDFEVIRDKIPLFSVDATYMINDKTGYIKINRFAASTVKEFQEGLAKLKEEGMENLIVDLRGNSGGYLRSAIQLADEFLDKQKLIVYTEGRTNPREDKFSTVKGGFETGKLVVMIDEGSASASEIVSGAIQDWDRGIIVGRRSFGKGLVQKPYMLPDGSAIRLTVSRYYTPSGRSIQRPYDDGNKKNYYQDDYNKRLENGEFWSADSIDVPDSLKYETNNGRAVYGGGGIIPDIFVGIDTTKNSKYHLNLMRKGIYNRFALTYMDNNRKKLLKQFSDVKSFDEGFEMNDEFMQKFIDFGEKKKVEFNEEEYNRSKEIITTLLKANLARNLYDINAYWVILNQINDGLQRATEVIADDTFNVLKLSNK